LIDGGTEGMVRIIARSFGQEVMTLLLDRWGGDVKITEEVVMAAAGNWRDRFLINAFFIPCCCLDHILRNLDILPVDQEEVSSPYEYPCNNP
jgi:hypothetical protein